MIRSNLFGFGDILLSHEALQQRHRASMSLSLSDQEKYVGPTPRRRFAKLSVRNYHSTRHSSTKPNIRIDRSRHCPCFALWPIVTSFSDIKMRRWIRKCISWKIVTGNPGDTLGKRAIGLKEFLDGQPSAFKRNEQSNGHETAMP